MIKRLRKYEIIAREKEISEYLAEKDCELTQFGVSELKVLKRMIDAEMNRRNLRRSNPTARV